MDPKIGLNDFLRGQAKINKPLASSPVPPSEYIYLVDSSGNYLKDNEGNYLVVENI